MAHIGKWGTFLHIPKTGGAWVRYHLRENFGRGEECGPTHGWPHFYQRKKGRKNYLDPQPPYFCFVRHPATWWRSFFHYSGKRKWNEIETTDHGYGHWALLLNLTKDFKEEKWEDFAVRVCTERAGLGSWFFHSYMFPGVLVGRMEDQPYALQKVTGLFINAEPTNTQSDLPEIPGWLWGMFEASEHEIYNEYYKDYKDSLFAWQDYEYPSLRGMNPAFLKGE